MHVTVQTYLRMVAAVFVLFGTGMALAGTFRLERVAAGLNGPTCMETAPGDLHAIYIAEYTSAANVLGRILRRDLVTHSNVVFLDLSGVVAANSFNGLLQFAFHPGYQTNGKLYVTYQFRVGSNPRVGRLAEYKVMAGVPTFQRIILEHDLNAGHSINMPFFRPGGEPDHLFVITGDGGPEAGSTGYTVNRAQNLATTWGKLLRMDVADGLDDYPADPRKNFGIPSANTSVTNPPGRLGEVIASGFRNPWRASFDSVTGDLYIGDNGFHTAEEENFIKADVFYPVSASIPDYGWPAFEGIYHPVPSANAFVQNLPTNTGALFPIISRTAAVLDAGVDVTGDGLPDATGDGDDSAIAGYVYRGPVAELYGKYIYADYQAQRVYLCAFDRNTPSSSYNGSNVTGFTNITAWLESTLPGADLNSIVSFHESPSGDLYIVDMDGEIFAIVPVPGNDDFGNAFPLVGPTIVTNGSSVGATLEGGEPFHAGDTNAPSVWLQWTAPGSGMTTLTLTNRSGPQFDSLLSVYTGGSVSQLATNVSHHGGTNGSQVVFNCVAGETYRIAVAGAGRTFGQFDLALHYGQTPVLTSVSLQSEGFQFLVTGTPGVAYVIEASTNLLDWSSVATNVAVFTNLDASFDSFPRRFFRARYSP
jgi:glucose/arabinose dehydrogenase